MRRLLFLFVSIVGLATSGYAQQDPMYSQYMFNTLALNPAYAGSREVVSMTALFRKQWVNTPGSPRTVTFSADAPLSKEKVGLGMVVFNDKIGITNTTGAYVSYAYRIRMKRGTLAMGLQAGFNQFQADYTSVILEQGGTTGGDAAFSTNLSKFLPNFGTGLYYNTDRFYIGVSMPKILNNKLFKKSDTLAVSVSSAQQTRHLFIMGGFVVPLSADVKLKPSTLIKLVEGAPIQVDINTNVWFYDAIAAGVSYRTSGALVGMIEIQATKQIRIGYAYDAGLGKTRNIGRGAHEIMARYEFGYVKAKVLSPRYF
jgi:type IX secretion system PorP/SprF family membrane protein